MPEGVDGTTAMGKRAWVRRIKVRCQETQRGVGAQDQVQEEQRKGSGRRAELFQPHSPHRFCPSGDTPHAAFHHVFILLAARPRSRSIVGRPMADQARWNCIGIPVHPGILKPPPRCDGDANGNYGIQGCTGRFPRITEYYHEMDERGEQYLETGPISVVRE